MPENAILPFLSDLKGNNKKEWFEANRERYLQAKSAFTELVRAALNGLAAENPALAAVRPEDCIFRIHQDQRFTKDKAPYKAHFGAILAPEGTKTRQAGYYIHLEDGGSMLGAGAYSPDSKSLKAIRDAILDEPDAFSRIIESDAFRQTFGEIRGEKVKTLPRGVDKDHPRRELVRFKSYEILVPLRSDELLDPEFFDRMIEAFRQAKPYNDFLNKALNF